jgi:hypothetical protein
MTVSRLDDCFQRNIGQRLPMKDTSFSVRLDFHRIWELALAARQKNQARNPRLSKHCVAACVSCWKSREPFVPRWATIFTCR